MGGGFRLSCFGFGSQLSSSSPLAMLTLELGVSENWGTLFRGPCNKDPTI